MNIARWWRRLRRCRRIFILVEHLHRHEGIGALMLAQRKMLRACGHDVELMAFAADAGMEQYLGPSAALRDLAADDIVILHYAGYTRWLERQELFRARTVLYYHNTTPGGFFRPDDETQTDVRDGEEQRLRPWIARFNRLAAVSGFNARALTDIGGAAPTVIPILLDHEEYAPLPAATLPVPDEIVVLAIGKFAPHKNQLAVIDCFREFAVRAGRPCRLVLLGALQFPGTTPAYGEACRAAATDLGDRVVFADSATQLEKCGWLRRTHLLISASLHEGFCTPLVEAMLFRVPVVAYAAAAVPETLGAGGMLVEPGDREGFVKGMLRLTRDPEAREKVVAQQQELLRCRYNPGLVSQQWRELLALCR